MFDHQASHSNSESQSSGPSFSLFSGGTTRSLPAVRLSKRAASLSILAILLNGRASSASMATLPQEVELERYTDSEEGFTLLKPSSWVKVDKAGARCCLRSQSNRVGVAVSPVRLASLGEFGSPQFVADKLIQAEKRKVGACSIACFVLNMECLMSMVSKASL